VLYSCQGWHYIWSGTEAALASGRKALALPEEEWARIVMGWAYGSSDGTRKALAC
jgi:hypothetical protein